MKTVVDAIKSAIIRQEKKQKDIAKAIYISPCRLCRILKGESPLQPDVAACLLEHLNLEDLAEFYCAGCRMSQVLDRRRYRKSFRPVA